MPLYEYRCPECGHRFELLTTISEGHRNQTCPQCGRDGAEKLVSAFSSSSSGSSGGCSSSGGRFT
ncbi:MAG: zinc ribbon domain-containing protein [Vicinamibacteria bacterium]|nr:zinc ribbon domain-containing protein [Vicinamibacteria bacterium]